MAGPIRHPIDIKALEHYLEENVPDIKTPLEVKQFGFGQSNPTYLLLSATTPPNKYVLRKKPPGALLSTTAHNVEREARILTALSNYNTTTSPSSSLITTDLTRPLPPVTGPFAGTIQPADLTHLLQPPNNAPTSTNRGKIPVPRVLTLVPKAGILDTPFYIMAFCNGTIHQDASMPALSPTQRSAHWKAAVQTLARLHNVDVVAAGLEGFGKSGGFYGRQLKRWRQICAAQAAVENVGELPKMTELMGWFEQTEQEGKWPRDRSEVVHGDYKIDNMVFEGGEVVGILDWEMSTIGHPLSDLSNLTTQFYTSHIPPYPSNATGVFSQTFLPNVTPGIPSLTQLHAWYTEVSGISFTLEEIRWAMVFNIFRLAAVCQGIAARVARGQASSAEAKAHATSRGPLAEFAWRLAQGGDPVMGGSRQERGKL